MAQNSTDIEIQIEWKDPIVFKDISGQNQKLEYFTGALYDYPESNLPVYSTLVPLSQSTSSIEVEIMNASYDTFERRITLSDKDKELIKETSVVWTINTYRKNRRARIEIVPIRESASGNLEKLTSFILKVTESSSKREATVQRSFKSSSVLSSGNWYKIATVKEGVHKLTYGQLNSLGMEMSDLRSSQIRLFGNGAKMLPFDNSDYRIDDLKENNILVVDGGDGNFDDGDYLLFYADSPVDWFLENGYFRHSINFFSDTAFFFVTRDNIPGSAARVSELNLGGIPDITVNDFLDHQLYERNDTNFIMSGRQWYDGQSFLTVKSRQYTFNVPNVKSVTAHARIVVLSRVFGRSSSFSLSFNDIGNFSIPISQSTRPGPYDKYAIPAVGTFDFIPSGNSITIDLTFDNSSFADNGWLDYIELNTTRALAFTGQQFNFRNPSTLYAAVARYNLTSSDNDVSVWDVTDPQNAVQLRLQGAAGNFYFQQSGDTIREYVVFGNSQHEPLLKGPVPNQNLHSIQQADYVIVVHPKFLSEANRLGQFHRSTHGYNVVVVTTEQVYNEFSSGKQDMTAIKDFMKMLADRASTDEEYPNWLLLFGDASYNYKDGIVNNTSFIPSYQSNNSLEPLKSFISDDYFGFLDDDESDAISSSLDIGIGRLPVQTIQEANAVVNKLILYQSSPSAMRPWRTMVTFVGDDEDSNTHMVQSDNLARRLDTTHQEYNIKKIYLDAYPQVSNSGGDSYPDVKELLDKSIEGGSLILSYIGHGGEAGWTSEGVLRISQIIGYENITKLPVFLTATCEFSRFDDPNNTSGGELMLLNPSGGGAGLLTTTRVVYSGPNYELSRSFFQKVFEKVDGEYQTLGELTRSVKDVSGLSGSRGINYRNFSLLGDPAMKLAYPRQEMQIEQVQDTIKSLEKVTISGFVKDQNGAVDQNFNGIAYPVVYDKEKEISTLNNDGAGVFKFDSRDNIVFRGKVSVTNGRFTFEFITPKDIDLSFGEGRISLYAEDGTVDAAGYDEDFIIGGRSDNPIIDDEGPVVNLWMNDENFAIGGITDQNPTILLKAFDESGINTVGNGIGHDMVAVLDENTSNPIILNDFYEADLDSYQSGSARYKLSNLQEGKHTLRVKVWDVNNNSGEAFTEFYVASDGNFTVDNVLNYPNPFTTQTQFHFDHNAGGQELDVRVQIFTVSGKLVKTIDHRELADSYHIGPLHWDGRDEFGDKIARGTYVYKVKVTNQFGQTVEKYEKLVIL
jgi:hypothetical protein